MSSNLSDVVVAAPLAPPRRGRKLAPRTWMLRTRLIVVVAVLGAGLCTAVGAGTLIALRDFLIGQLDNQVFDAQSRSMAFYEIGPPPFVRFSGPGPMFLDGPGQSAGTVGAVVAQPGQSQAAVILTSGDRRSVSSAALKQLEQVPEERTVSVDLDGLGPYRLVAESSNDGVVVAGLPLSGVQQTLRSVTWMIGGFSALALAAAIAAGTVMIRRELVPLSRMSEAAQHVAGLPLHEGEVRLPAQIEPVSADTAHTEVGRLGTALNSMVDRVADGLATRHASETRVRQFVADASHELRTPLASIQGYTEVARRLVTGIPGDATDASRDDLVYALTRVHAESRRMSQLVEDMLLLARLDAGRPLAHDEVDLSQMVIDAVSDAHMAGPEHRWALDLPDHPVIAVGDRPRLQQVLTNLLSNARVHTPAGTTVVTALTDTADGAISLTVSDNGPGIPADVLPDIFERFARGDESRSRAAGSTGLGLAIAQAVAKAHRGTIAVDSSPNGSAFTVTLPARDA
ncbi:sensor histidine kinase [Mycolicibacterium mucogenicum]|uniref:histidine kinase n=3 Tax=Mycolicibacterium mucogenicum TaxID=56689 RepID=A0A8H2PID0_MYCMU|nr:HAMP domain-containing sensor histidine kinase [Mycolicibacterium mucogenicum]